MDWKLDNLNERQRQAIRSSGYVGAFLSVIKPRLLAEPPPKLEPVESPLPDVPANTYVPLAKTPVPPLMPPTYPYEPLEFTSDGREIIKK